MKAAATSLAVMLLALGMFHLWPSGPGDTAPELTRDPAPVPGSAESQAEALAPALEEAEELLREEALLEASTESPSGEPQSTVPAAEPVLLRGSVVVVDASGVELTGLSGTIEFTRWQDNGGEGVECEVRSGEFVVDVTEADGLSVDDLNLSDRGAVPESTSLEIPVDQGPIVVRAHWTQVMRLNVLSRETGAHLTDVEIVSGQGLWSTEEHHPGRLAKAERLLTGGYSPIELQPSTTEARNTDIVYYLRSPGYAWKAVHLDLTRGGEREVRLGAGGGLILRLAGERPPRGANFRLYSTSEEDELPHLEVGARSADPLELDGIVPATYRAAVEVGDWFDRPLVLGELEVLVEAGARGQYVLTLEPQQEAERARLAGTLVVPEAWELASFVLKAELSYEARTGADEEHELAKGAMERIPGRDDSWAFDFGEISTGPYTLEFSSGGFDPVVAYSTSVILEAGGLANVLVELPPPAQVAIQLVEAESGDVTSVSYIHWNAIHPTAPGFGSLVSARLEDGETRFEFRAPVGQISVGSFGTGYTSLNETLEIRPGLNEFTFKLEQECPLVITFLDGETPVPLSEHWYPSPEALDGEGRLLYTTSGTSGFKTALSAPGRYRFEMPAFPDFEPIPAQTIAVERGEDTVHVVKLVRLRD